MATTIYEVNLTVDKDVASEYRDWLKGHIVEMLQFEGFESYQWLEREEEEDEEHQNWTIQYKLSSREALQKYFEEHAATMRADGQRLFGGKFQATRRIMKVLDW